MLYLRELFATLPPVLSDRLLEQVRSLHLCSASCVVYHVWWPAVSGVSGCMLVAVLQAGEEVIKAGEKCVLMKERGVMVVGLSSAEWRLLLEKTGGSDRMQMISGVEEAVVRGLSQSEGTPDTQTDLKNSWNAWALKLCDGQPYLCSKARALSVSSFPRRRAFALLSIPSP